MNTVRSALAVTALLAVVPAHAQSTVATEKQLPLPLALEAAQGTLDQCRKDGFRVSVTVLNNAGQPIVLLRDGGTGPHTADTSRRKAYTSLTFRAPTTALSKRLAETPALANLNNVTDVLVLGGGVPIRSGNDTIGAIGVSGTPTGEKDEACGQAGIDRIADRLK
jgi:uncharacterized protein GlcG (DUF336 family)